MHVLCHDGRVTPKSYTSGLSLVESAEAPRHRHVHFATPWSSLDGHSSSTFETSCFSRLKENVYIKGRMSCRHKLRDHCPRTIALTGSFRVDEYVLFACGLIRVSCWMYPKKSKTQKKLKNKNCVCTFPGPVFCIIVSAWTCMIMEFQLVDGVQFFLVLSVLVALPTLW